MTFPTSSVLDNFDRADANPISGSWANFPRINTPRLKILTNQVQTGTASSTCADYYTASTYGPDSEVGYTCATLHTNVAERFEVFLRASNPTLSTATAYRMRVTKAGAGYDWTIWYLDTGTSTQITVTPVNSALTAGDKIGFEVIGSTLKGYRFTGGSWTNILTETHSTLTAAGNIGAAINGDAGVINDFFGGTVGASGSTFTKTGLGIIGP